MMADASSARDTRKERIPKQDEVHQKRITSKKSADGERFDPKERVRRQATAAGDRRIARIVRRRCANPRRESFGRFWEFFVVSRPRGGASRLRLFTTAATSLVSRSPFFRPPEEHANCDEFLQVSAIKPSSRLPTAGDCAIQKKRRGNRPRRFRLRHLRLRLQLLARLPEEHFVPAQ